MSPEVGSQGREVKAQSRRQRNKTEHNVALFKPESSIGFITFRRDRAQSLQCACFSNAMQDITSSRFHTSLNRYPKLLINPGKSCHNSQ